MLRLLGGVAAWLGCITSKVEGAVDAEQRGNMHLVHVMFMHHLLKMAANMTTPPPEMVSMRILSASMCGD